MAAAAAIMTVAQVDLLVIDGEMVPEPHNAPRPALVLQHVAGNTLLQHSATITLQTGFGTTELLSAIHRLLAGPASAPESTRLSTNCAASGARNQRNMPVSQYNEESLLAALRDFFMAADGPNMATAYARLAAVAVEPAPLVEDWLPVEFAFNRLFVGPRALLAPPYASVYLDPEPQLMGQTTLRVRELYRLLDLRSPWENVIPDDHISFELDACHQMLVAQQTVASPELDAVCRYLTGHLQRWIPAFAARVQAAPGTPPALLFVVEQVQRWLERVAARPASPAQTVSFQPVELIGVVA
jgi:TorA maturation chaperone TorD